MKYKDYVETELKTFGAHLVDIEKDPSMTQNDIMDSNPVFTTSLLSKLRREYKKNGSMHQLTWGTAKLIMEFVEKELDHNQLTVGDKVIESIELRLQVALELPNRRKFNANPEAFGVNTTTLSRVRKKIEHLGADKAIGALHLDTVFSLIDYVYSTAFEQRLDYEQNQERYKERAQLALNFIRNNLEDAQLILKNSMDIPTQDALHLSLTTSANKELSASKTVILAKFAEIVFKPYPSTEQRSEKEIKKIIKNSAD